MYVCMISLLKQEKKREIQTFIKIHIIYICMRIARTFTIEEDIIKKLNKSGNKSELINRILKEYFDKEDINQMSAKQLRAEIEVRKLEKETKVKIKELRKNGN